MRSNIDRSVMMITELSPVIGCHKASAIAHYLHYHASFHWIAVIMKIEVIYALPERQELATLDMPEGSTALQAVEASGLLPKYPDIEAGSRNKLGVFGKLVKTDTVLRDRDRVEIYRPLIADPKEVRRQKAAEGKVMKRGAAELNTGEPTE